MTPAKKSHVPLSHWDKFLFITIGIVAVLAFGIVLWFRGLDVNPSVVVPTPTMPVPNARDYFDAAVNIKVDDKWVSGDAFKDNSPAGIAAKERTLRLNTKAFQLLHQGFRYSYQAQPTRSFSTIYPSLQKYRSLTRVLGLQANVKAQKGDWNGSINAALDGVQLGEKIPRGGTLITMLVGDACESIGRRQAWTDVAHLNAAQARAAARRLEDIRADHVPFADTLQEEKWTVQASLLEMMRRPDWPGAGWNTNGGAVGTVENATTATRTRLTGKRTIMAHYTEYMDQCIANARQPFAAHLPTPPVPSDPMNQMLLSTSDSFGGNTSFVIATKADTLNALLSVLLALRAYKLEHGSYPATLAALVPGYLKAVPMDPFALSGPLSYKVQGMKFLLYSVGPDGKDDGGVAVFDKTVSPPRPNETSDHRYYVLAGSSGDIVAGVNVN